MKVFFFFSLVSVWSYIERQTSKCWFGTRYFNDYRKLVFFKEYILHRTFSSCAKIENLLLFYFQGTAMFLHWLVGMVYVFYFASFVLLLREVLRPGVLWFLRNLNDPDFHPVQEVRDFFKLCPRIDYQPLFAKWSHVSPAEDFREDRKPKPRKRRISSLVMVDPLSKLFKKLSPREENREPWEIWSVFSQGCCVSVKLKALLFVRNFRWYDSLCTDMQEGFCCHWYAMLYR